MVAVASLILGMFTSIAVTTAAVLAGILASGLILCALSYAVSAGMWVAGLCRGRSKDAPG